MKLQDGKCVQWHDGEQFHVGREQVGVEGGVFPVMKVTAEDGLLFECDIDLDDCVLVKHSHTGELEFVEYQLLSPYPDEPIPTP